MDPDLDRKLDAIRDYQFYKAIPQPESSLRL